MEFEVVFTVACSEVKGDVIVTGDRVLGSVGSPVIPMLSSAALTLFASSNTALYTL